MKQHSRILIEQGTIKFNNGWTSGSYLFIQNGKIEDSGQGTPPIRYRKEAELTINAKNRAVLPGMKNAHTHLSQAFMRGLAAGLPLKEWLVQKIWPLQNAVTPEELHLAALLGIVENIRCGVTDLTNNHKITTTSEHIDTVCDAAELSGIRMTLALGWAENAEQTYWKTAVRELERLFNSSSDRLTIANGPIAPWRCSPEGLRATEAAAKANGSFTHIHTAEVESELNDFKFKYGVSPIGWLDQLELLGPKTQLVHAVWLEPEDFERLSENGTGIVHCPVSNAVLGSGIAPLSQFKERGIEIQLGTDGPASNDNQDIFETMKAALCLARAAACDPSVITPEDVLHWASGGDALQTGDTADIIIVSLDHPRVVPVHDMTSAMVLSTHGCDVETVIVNGVLLMHKNEILFLNEGELLSNCRTAASGLLKRAGITSKL